MTIVREILVDANEQALNAAMTERQIQADKIISVMFEPQKPMAIGDHTAKYRVLYQL